MLDWSKCAARLESFIFDYSLIKQILSVQHEHMTRYINQLRHLLALISRRALEKTFRNVHLGIKRSNHLVMCHSIQHLQEFILLLLLLKLFIGCDIRKVYELAPLWRKVNLDALHNNDVVTFVSLVQARAHSIYF